jgi:protein-S-isoprenylcysteine O-methyltransferase Ste14
MFSKLKATFTRATDAVNDKVLTYIPASNASKIAKMMILALTFMFVMPMQAQAADFISEAIDILGIVIIAIGGGLGIWGVVNLLEGYGNDNPGAKSQGIKQLMAGLGLILLGIFAIPQLETLLPTA